MDFLESLDKIFSATIDDDVKQPPFQHNITKFSELEHHPHKICGGTQCLVKFDNGYGASVVRFDGSYGFENGLYELAVVEVHEKDEFRLNYDTEITDDVIGHLTEERVSNLLKKIALLPKREKTCLG